MSRERYRVDKMGNNAKPWPTPTLTLKGSEDKLFHKYLVLL